MSFTERHGILRCQAFDAQFAWQDHGFGTRVAAPAFAAPVITLRQVHSAAVHAADKLADRELEGDALTAVRIGCAVGVRTADCVPILLLDPVNRAIAAVHAGWRGTAARIAARAAESLLRFSGAQADTLRAAIGPCIRACCYEVTGDVAARFARWPAGILDRAPAKPHLDLAAINCTQLLEAGLLAEHVFDCGLCTACDPARFFSYRREPHNPGRMTSAIVRTA